MGVKPENPNPGVSRAVPSQQVLRCTQRVGACVCPGGDRLGAPLCMGPSVHSAGPAAQAGVRFGKQRPDCPPPPSPPPSRLGPEPPQARWELASMLLAPACLRLRQPLTRPSPCSGPCSPPRWAVAVEGGPGLCPQTAAWPAGCPGQPRGCWCGQGVHSPTWGCGLGTRSLPPHRGHGIAQNPGKALNCSSTQLPARWP